MMVIKIAQAEAATVIIVVFLVLRDFFSCSPVQFSEREVSALALVRLEVNTGLKAIHLKGLQDHTLGIQLWKPTDIQFYTSNVL